MFWVESILGMDNGKVTAFLYFRFEREETSQSHSNQEVMLILFEKSQNIYIHLNFSERELTLQYVEDLLGLVRIGLAVFTVKGCPVLS